MKRITYTILVAVLVAAAFSLNPTAQAPSPRIVFVNSQQLIDAHPSGAAARQLEQQGREELRGIESSLNDIIERAQSGMEITPAEQEQFQLLQMSLETTAQRWDEEVMAAAEPAVLAIDEIVKAYAAEQGFSIIMDFEVARMSGLVVYAEEGLDVTEAVLQRLQ